MTPDDRIGLRSGARTILTVLGKVVLVAGIATWAFGGFHLGWTQTRVAERTIDEITGIEAVAWRDGFVAGIDWLAGVVVVASVLIVVGRLLRPPRAAAGPGSRGGPARPASHGTAS